ncbi:alpha/beta fold hydrolase [Chryseobacterium sp. T20]|uniref:alpha/beta fold hydrolase n=1 Tax=Chryseobacterium sp. T20 TaxID=3395375 RepID=UPI0039BC7A50
MNTNKFNPEDFTSSIEVDSNVQLEVMDIGEGPVVILIHGWPLNNEMFESQAQFLFENGYRVIAPSLRGYGSSSKPDGEHSYEVFSKDIHQIVKKLSLTDFVIGGYSMGAAIAMYYTAHYGEGLVKQLWLISGAAPVYTQKEDFTFDGPTVESVNENIAFLNEDRPELVKGVIGALWSPLSSMPDEHRHWLFSLGMEASFQATEQSMIALRDSDLRKEMTQIQIPVTIFHGRHDIISPLVLAQTMEKGFSNAELITFENSGHAIPWEEPKLFNQSLLKSLTK